MSLRMPSMPVGRSTTVGPSVSRARNPTAYIVDVFPVSTSDVESISVSQMQTWLLAFAPAAACPLRSWSIDMSGMESMNASTARARSR